MSEEFVKICPRCGHGLTKDQPVFTCFESGGLYFCHYCAEPQGSVPQTKLCPYCGKMARGTKHLQTL